MKLGVCCVVVLNLVLAETALAEEVARPTQAEIAAINKVISKCLDLSFKRDPAYKDRFDAFYKASTGRIETNVDSQGDRDAFFRFRKCMALQGWPMH